MGDRERSLHEAVLGKGLVKMGFRLEEDEDFAYLYLNGKQIGKYSSTVTLETLRRDAIGFAGEPVRGLKEREFDRTVRMGTQEVRFDNHGMTDNCPKGKGDICLDECQRCSCYRGYEGFTVYCQYREE